MNCNFLLPSNTQAFSDFPSGLQNVFCTRFPGSRIQLKSSRRAARFENHLTVSNSDHTLAHVPHGPRRRPRAFRQLVLSRRRLALDSMRVRGWMAAELTGLGGPCRAKAATETTRGHTTEEQGDEPPAKYFPFPSTAKPAREIVTPPLPAQPHGQVQGRSCEVNP